MPYSLNDFKEAGLYIPKEAPEVDIEVSGGRVISNLPDKLRRQLSEVGGGRYQDPSRQDSSVISSLLSHGLSTEDCFATFMASKRGRDALSRKPGHVVDYVSRTIKSAVSFLGKNGHNKPNGHLEVDFSRKRPDIKGEGIITVKAKDVEVETPNWLWHKYLPAGRITILAGDPGLGKSTLALDLVSRVSRGAMLPLSDDRSVSGTCLVASAEDATADTIVPRLIATRADLNRIEVMREVKEDDEVHYLSFPRDLERFRESIVKRGARIAIIDPFNAFLSKEADSHKDQDIRLVLAPIEAIAEETGAAILIVAHLNKKEDASALYRVGGSIGFTGAARSVLGVSRVPGKETRVLYSLKSNLSKRPPSLEYEVKGIRREKEDETEWKGEEKVKSSIIRWLGEIDFDPTQGATSKSAAERVCESFLKQILVDSEMDCEEIFREARKVGIPKGQLIRMRDEVGIQMIRQHGKWCWKLPS